MCNAYDGEDPSCARNQLAVSIKNHLFYAGLDIGNSGPNSDCAYAGSVWDLLVQSFKMPNFSKFLNFRDPAWPNK